MQGGWIKICGMTSPGAVAAALDAGADAIGFVFAPSVRRLDVLTAGELALPARGRLACIAVTRHPRQSEIDEILAQFRPDALQTDFGDFAALRLPRELGRLPVLRADAPMPPTLPARVLFEGPVSGAGVTSDWERARALAGTTELVLAGGLDPANVARAIREVRPFGVDVSSGVEERPGVKSSARIDGFVKAARSAFGER